ncbi:hypothetical protein [Halostella salina]|uniref:hypothetical protein n=1 Tax=Halostella salina TaxID=1547897 RepID=UPI000EF79C94|nr:hypothetical protein [Halostella salina]
METDMRCTDCHGRVVRGEVDGEVVLSCICKVMYVERGVVEVDEWVPVEDEEKRASPVTA